MVRPNIRQDPVEVEELVNVSLSFLRHAAARAVHGDLTSCRVAFLSHCREPFRAQADVGLDAVDARLRGLSDCDSGICQVGTGPGHDLVRRSRSVQERSQAQDAGPSVLLPFSPAIEYPRQRVPGIPNRRHSEREELRALSTQEMDVCVDQARQNRAILLAMVCRGLRYGIARHDIGDHAVPHQDRVVHKGALPVECPGARECSDVIVRVQMADLRSHAVVSVVVLNKREKRKTEDGTRSRSS